MKAHRYTHTGEKAHKCVTCNESFVSMKGLKRHKRKAHPEQYVKCLLCPALFPSEKIMEIHRKVHNGKLR